MKNAQKTATKDTSKVKVVPLGDRVLVRPVQENEEKTQSGIYIPDTVKKEKSDEGTVIAVGEGKYIDGKLVPVSVKVGDKVMFSKYGFEEIKIDGEEYFILREDSILAIIK